MWSKESAIRLSRLWARSSALVLEADGESCSVPVCPVRVQSIMLPVQLQPVVHSDGTPVSTERSFVCGIPVYLYNYGKSQSFLPAILRNFKL